MKKWLAILFIFSLYAPFIATNLHYNYTKARIRHEVKHKIMLGIPKEELALVKIHRNHVFTQLKWEHSKEFEYQHQMYDVVEQINKGDTVYFYCWLDNEETLLNKKLLSITRQRMGHNPQTNHYNLKIKQFYFSLFFNCHAIQTLAPSYSFDIRFVYSFFIKSYLFDVPSPPPECCL